MVYELVKDITSRPDFSKTREEAGIICEISDFDNKLRSNKEQT
jgi:hypothetical protein